jgi:CubicO group peptidase (beta-lactamase class C family)
MSPAVASNTLRQLLTMTAGLPSGTEGAFMQSEDLVREILTAPESAPGGPFLYSNRISHLLAAVLEQATGTSTLEVARSRLFDRLGIDTRPAFRRVVTPQMTAEDLSAYESAGSPGPLTHKALVPAGRS